MSSEKLSYPRFQRASDHSLLVTFGERISLAHHRDVLRLFRLLYSTPNRAIRNIHPAYSSVLISFDPLITRPERFDLYVRRLVDRLDDIEVAASREVEVPVCYDKTLGPDLEFVAHHNGLTTDDVIRHHTSVEYLVYFVGFSPGFPYLGELPYQLQTPRLSTPRVIVPEGSVAIGGNQTGIYPIASPGGWRIIGRTPLKLFDPLRMPPTTLEIGDMVRFKPISVFHYQSLLGAVDKL
jgi:KipI family sensor histidine kinase inhibitor